MAVVIDNSEIARYASRTEGKTYISETAAESYLAAMWGIEWNAIAPDCRVINAIRTLTKIERGTATVVGHSYVYRIADIDALEKPR